MATIPNELLEQTLLLILNAHSEAFPHVSSKVARCRADLRHYLVRSVGNQEWKCPKCGMFLDVNDWTYSDLAHRGIPICGACDNDMELMDKNRTVT